MLPACEDASAPIQVATLVQPPAPPGTLTQDGEDVRPGTEDDILESEIGVGGSPSFAASAFNAASAIMSSK